MTITERDTQLIERYQEGGSLEDLGREFGLTRSRIYQILKKAGVQVRRNPQGVEFLGVNLSEAVKRALRKEAQRRGLSMSTLSSQTLRDMLRSCGYPLEADKI